MPSLFFLSFLSLIFTAAAQQKQLNITLDSSLTPTKNTSWLSPSGLYAFGFYPQDNGYGVGIFIAGIPQKTVVWTANRDDPPVPSNVALQFTSDGRLVLLSTQGQELANITTDATQATSKASMLDSGNFVLYGSDEEIIWQSFEHPTDTLVPGQKLLAGDGLFSSRTETDHSSGLFCLQMQHDGHLVQYPAEGPYSASYAYWASGTMGSGDNVTLNLDDNGHLYLLNSTGFNIKNVTEGGYLVKDTIYLMRIDADGIFRVYSHNLDENSKWSIVSKSSNDTCAPMGLCGLNGFCVMIDQEADCRCLPGFKFVNEGNWSSGCERNLNVESCGNKNGNVKYTIEALPQTRWEDIAYSVLSLSTQEDCENACSEDCNCEAALFDDRTCSKQRLPLRFGRRNLNYTNVALIKVGKSTIEGGLLKQGKKETRMDILLISVSFVTFSVIILAISGFLIYRSHVWAYKKISTNGNAGLSEYVGPRSFTYAELEKVTEGFKEEIGKGSFGTVYKGMITEDQKAVAVKRLDKVLAEGEGEFQTEMKVIGRTHHRNLVRLLGYCIDGPHRLLVYEYMSNGSLADVLFTAEEPPCWDERMEIARYVAKGILYLHEECETQIIHCDIKPQNILMDEYRCAKISDFGLAKLMKPDQTRTFTVIRGTKGYVAPEWHRKLPVTVKADVYSFGIVLLEIICCRRSVDWSISEEEAILEEWVYHCFEVSELGKLVSDEFVDKRQLERMVKVGLWCILDEPSLRPSMKKVLLMLEGTVDIPPPPSPFFTAI